MTQLKTGTHPPIPEIRAIVCRNTNSQPYQHLQSIIENSAYIQEDAHPTHPHRASSTDQEEPVA
ncbi:MAG TPA: hypothetical protein VIM11_01600, partial [Tepidisphaeraceae bacterium]